MISREQFRFSISDEQARYLAVQHLGMEGFASRAAWEAAYTDALFEAYEQMAPHLPAACASILDIGSGLGGIDAILNQHFGGRCTVHCLDGEEDPPVVERHAKPFNSRDVTQAFLSANGVRRVHYMTPDDLRPVDADLIISAASWCFHYPPETYLQFVKSCCRAGTVLIIEVRKNRGWRRVLDQHFKRIGTAGTYTKFERAVYAAS